MTQPLHYASSLDRPRARALMVCANVSAAFPIVPLAVLYGEWLISLWMHGYITKYPSQSIVAPIVLIILSLIPVGVVALVLNIFYINICRPTRFPLFRRITIVTALWAGTWLLLSRDPGSVIVRLLD